MDGGARWATIHRVAKSWIQLSDFTSLQFGGLKEKKYRKHVVSCPVHSEYLINVRIIPSTVKTKTLYI